MGVEGVGARVVGGTLTGVSIHGYSIDAIIGLPTTPEEDTGRLAQMTRMHLALSLGPIQTHFMSLYIAFT